MTAAEPKVAEVKICALSVLCMLTALAALRRIDESNGKLSGRHLAITGLCISATALAFWLALFVAGWIAWEILGWIF